MHKKKSPFNRNYKKVDINIDILEQKIKEDYDYYLDIVHKIIEINRYNIMGNSIVLFGVLLGLYATITTKAWWLVVVLFGSLFLVTMSMLGMIQKHIQLKKIFGLKEKEVNEYVE